MRKNPFKYVMSVKSLKDVMVYGMTPILRSIYKDLPNRWGPKDEPILTKNGLWRPDGVYDLNPITNKFDKWSGMNFFNTNYSMCYEALLYLNQQDVFIGFSDNESDESIKQKLRLFLVEIEKRKYDLFFDGPIKDTLCSIHNGAWNRGEKHSDNVKLKYKEIWPDATSLNDYGGEKGMLNDMLNGIDATIIFDDKEETIQTKGCIKVEKKENDYLVYCVVDYSKYKNINYFCFYPSNENKFYVFKNDNDRVKNTKINDEPVFVINESLIHFEGEK